MPEIKIKFCIGPQYFFVSITTVKEKGGNISVITNKQFVFSSNAFLFRAVGNGLKNLVASG
jgi:hypothetical protein